MSFQIDVGCRGLPVDLLRISCMEPFYGLFILCLQNAASLKLHLIFSVSDGENEVCYRCVCGAKK